MTGADSEGLQAVRLIAPAHCDQCGTRHHDGSPPCSRAQAPVVSSVGAVPVEVPADLLETVAKAIAETDDENGCFDRVAEYDALTGAEREDFDRAHGYPHDDFEDCEYYRRRAAAAYPLIAARVRAEERQRAVAVIHQEALRVADVPPDPVRTAAYWAGRVEGVLAAKTLVAKALTAGSAVPVATPQRPEIVVLCGSTRFKDAFGEAAKSEALAGRIVLTVSDLDPRPEMRNVNVPIDADTKARLDQLHRHKIDLADRVLVLNVGGYIGESTRSEIEYATAHGKPISYLESPASTTTCPHGLTVPHEDSSFVTGVTSSCPGPVATPPSDDGFELCEHGVIGQHTYGEDMEDQVAWRDCPGKRRPAATPTEPGRCSRCGFTGTDCTDDVCHGPVATTPPAGPKDLLTALQNSIDRARRPAEQDGQR